MRKEIYLKTQTIKNPILTIKTELEGMLLSAKQNFIAKKQMAEPYLLKVANTKLNHIKQQLNGFLAIIIFRGSPNHACVLEYVGTDILIYDPQPDNKFYATPFTAEIISNIKKYRGLEFNDNEIYIIKGFKF